MTRLAVITVGTTHSGKSTFAKRLEERLENATIIDQDNHGLFINKYYTSLRPIEGPNTLKYAITQTIVDYAVERTERHIILCNSNLTREGRKELLSRFRDRGFVTILIYFDIPEEELIARVTGTQRSKDIFRDNITFEELLQRQLKLKDCDGTVPTADESDYLFVIRSSQDESAILTEIGDFADRLKL